MTAPVRVRFAPSPTGKLHVGGARTAIYNWAFACKMGGTFVLRIDDTDPTRSTDENTQAILRSMRWLGLDWDEGPEVGGDFGPYFQMERMDRYQAALQQLIEADAVYPCFCTQEQLEAKRESAKRRNDSFQGYDRTCRRISKEEAQERIAAGEKPAWRIKVPYDRGVVTFQDAVRGECRFDSAVLDDFVIMRSDGTPTYNFTTVVDDVEMGITHVIRGDDHVSNTPRQIIVYEALGAPVPTFAHLSMILGSDGKRLSKRHGATSVEAYRDMGYLPEALMNYLPLLGWAPDGETTLFSTDELCEKFDLMRISHNPAVFDFEKLDWINMQYLKELTPAAYIDAAIPFFEEAGFATADEIAANRPWFEKIVPLINERCHRLDELAEKVGFLFGDTVELDPKSVDKVIAKEGVADILAATRETLEGVEDWSEVALEEAMRGLCEKLELKPKKVFQPLRVAVAGNMVSPPLFGSVELLGRERTLARIDAAMPLAK